MSYDIDIFTEDFLFIQNLIDNKLLIAQSLGIDKHNIEASPSAITFILSNDGAGLKLDFIYGEAITNKPYSYIDVLNQKKLKVQTPQEVISRKIKYRDILTVRDFVDFAYVQENHNMMKELQGQSIDNVDIYRYIDIVEQFINMPAELLNIELKLLDTAFNVTYESLLKNIKSIIIPEEIVEIIYDDDFEVVSIDSFNNTYIKLAQEYDMNYNTLTIEFKVLEERLSKQVTYNTILNISPELFKTLLHN